MKEFIIRELALLRAIEPKGSDRYNELTKAIDWLNGKKAENTDKKAENPDKKSRTMTKEDWDEFEKYQLMMADPNVPNELKYTW